MNQISSRAYIDIEVSKYRKMIFGEKYIVAMVAEDTLGKLQQIAKLAILRALVFGSNRL